MAHPPATPPAIARSSDSPQRGRVIGAGGATAIVAGSMLGIGIYLAPAEMAVELASGWTLLAIWAATGVIMLGGALAFAELATRFPEAGGDYVYLRECFGPSAAFAAGWGLFAAVFAGSVAAVSVALCHFQLPLLLGVDLASPWLEVPGWGPIGGDRLLAVGLVVLLTGLNVLGVRLSSAVQQLTTVVPALLLALLAIACLLLYFSGGLPPGQASSAVAGPPSMATLVRCYLLAYFAFSGWNAVVYVAGEVRDPSRNLPRALLGGTAAITALYVLLCAGFIAVLGMGGLARAGEAGSATAAAVLGEQGRWWMALLIGLSLLSTINAAVLGGARVAFAMAVDGAFWARAARLHPRYGTPAFALWLQAAWASILILSGGFDELLRAVSVAMIATASLAVIASWLLRRRRPAPAAFVPPKLLAWLPPLFVLAGAVAIAQQIGAALTGSVADWIPLVGLAVIAAAWVGHRWLRRSDQRP